jgi:hypothetical protein
MRHRRPDFTRAARCLTRGHGPRPRHPTGSAATSVTTAVTESHIPAEAAPRTRRQLPIRALGLVPVGPRARWMHDAKFWRGRGLAATAVVKDAGECCAGRGQQQFPAWRGPRHDVPDGAGAASWALLPGDRLRAMIVLVASEANQVPGRPCAAGGQELSRVVTGGGARPPARARTPPVGQARRA